MAFRSVQTNCYFLQVKHKYNETLAEVFRETFCWMPLAYTINKKVLVLHGGLFSEDGVKLDDIKAIDRNREPPDEGLMCEILWSDPSPVDGRQPSQRGVGVAFGTDAGQTMDTILSSISSALVFIFSLGFYKCQNFCLMSIAESCRLQ